MKKIYLTFVLFFACASPDVSTMAEFVNGESISWSGPSADFYAENYFQYSVSDGVNTSGVSIDNATELNIAATDGTNESRVNMTLNGITIDASDGVVKLQTNYIDRIIIKKSGVINTPNLPTSTSGLSSGDWYRSGSDLKIVP